MQISYIKKNGRPDSKEAARGGICAGFQRQGRHAPFIIRTDYFLQRPDTA